APLVGGFPSVGGLSVLGGALAAAAAGGRPLGVPARCETLTGGAGCGSAARPDLWEPQAGNRLGLPGEVPWSEGRSLGGVRSPSQGAGAATKGSRHRPASEGIAHPLCGKKTVGQFNPFAPADFGYGTNGPRGQADSANSQLPDCCADFLI